MNIEIEKQTLGSLARLSNVSTTEQVESYVEGYVEEYSKDTFVHLSGDSNVGTLTLSGGINLGINCSTVGNSLVGGEGSHTLKPHSIAFGLGTKTYSEHSYAIGDGSSCGGTRMFTVISSNATLETDKTKQATIIVKTNASGIKAGDLVSFIKGTDINGAGSYVEPISVNNVIYDSESDTSQITIDHPIMDSDNKCLQNSSGWLYDINKPELGELTAIYGLGACGIGDTAKALGHDSFAQGIKTTAVGKFSRSMGYNCKSGWQATAIGTGNEAWGNGSIALGGDSNTQGTAKNVVIHFNSPNSFAWSGNGTYEINDRPKTFNINPAGGAKGFYIGENTLSNIIDNAIKAHDAEILKDVEFDTSSTQNISYLINTLSTIINKLGGTVIS